MSNSPLFRGLLSYNDSEHVEQIVIHFRPLELLTIIKMNLLLRREQIYASYHIRLSGMHMLCQSADMQWWLASWFTCLLNLIDEGQSSSH